MTKPPPNLDFDDAEVEEPSRKDSKIPPPLSSHGYAVLRSTTMARLEAVLNLASELSDEIYRIESGPFGRCDCVDVENLIDGVEKAKFSLTQLRKK